MQLAPTPDASAGEHCPIASHGEGKWMDTVGKRLLTCAVRIKERTHVARNQHGGIRLGRSASTPDDGNNLPVSVGLLDRWSQGGRQRGAAAAGRAHEDHDPVAAVPDDRSRAALPDTGQQDLRQPRADGHPVCRHAPPSDAGQHPGHPQD